MVGSLNNRTLARVPGCNSSIPVESNTPQPGDPPNKRVSEFWGAVDRLNIMARDYEVELCRMRLPPSKTDFPRSVIVERATILADSGSII